MHTTLYINRNDRSIRISIPLKFNIKKKIQISKYIFIDKISVHYVETKTTTTKYGRKIKSSTANKKPKQ